MFKCLECNKSFTASSSLKVHMLSHSEIRPYACSLCDRSFCRNNYLKLHMRCHTGKAPFNCQLCGKIFKQSGNFKKHMRLHEGIKKFYCHLCDKKFFERYQLQNHVHLHTEQKPFVGIFDGKEFSQSANLDTHEKLHSSERTFHCSKCIKTFQRKDDLEKHSGTHLSVTSYFCLYCNKGFSRINRLAAHIKKVHGLQNGFGCRLCGQAFHDIKVFLKHTNDFLTNGYCEPQDKETEHRYIMDDQPQNYEEHNNNLIEGERMEYMVKSELSLPKAKVLKAENDLIVIEIGEVEQKDKQFLETHCMSGLKSNMHVSRKQWQKKSYTYKNSCFGSDSNEECQRWKNKFCCGFCGKLFKLGKRLETHFKSHKKDEQCNDSLTKESSTTGERVVPHSHTNEELCSKNTCEIVSDQCYICNLCEESFVSESDLIEHHCMHNSKSICECKKCVKILNSNPVFCSQADNRHALNGPFSCGICFKSLCSMDMLSHHMKVHCEWKPYVCSVCGKGFKQLWGIKKHVKKHYCNNVSNLIVSPKKTDFFPNFKKDQKMSQEIDSKESFQGIVSEVPKVSNCSDLGFSSVEPVDCLEIELNFCEQRFCKMNRYSSIDNFLHLSSVVH